MAHKPCYDVLKTLPIKNLSIRRSTGAGILYDIYANVVAQDIPIGRFCSNGTIKKHPIQVRLFEMDKHGKKESVMAFLDLAKEYFEGKLDKDSEILAREEVKVNRLRESIGQNRAKIEEIQTLKNE